MTASTRVGRRGWIEAVCRDTASFRRTTLPGPSADLVNEGSFGLTGNYALNPELHQLAAGDIPDCAHHIAALSTFYQPASYLEGPLLGFQEARR